MSSQVFTTTGSQTWTWPAGVTSVTVEALGGGGGGGSASANPSSGGGGKGGSYSKATVTKGAETTLTVVVGAGGAIAAAGAASSVTQSSTTVCLAPGGGGGATTSTASTNGAGGTTLNGTAVGTTLAGGNGGTGNFTSGVAGSGGGGGAAGPTGAGGAASVNVAGIAGTGTFLNGIAYSAAGVAGVGNSTAGAVGLTYGGGASGGKTNSGSTKTGAAGAQGIVVLTWTDAPTTLQLRTTSGKQRIADSAAILTLPMSPTPVVGSGVVLAVWGSWSFPLAASPMVFGPNWVTDNFGNPYKLALTRQITGSTNMAVAIYYCEKIVATGSPFTISITPTDGARHYMVASAREIGGLPGPTRLTLVQSVSNTGTSAGTANPGTTASVTGEALVVAAMTRGGVVVASSITVETLFPNWAQEIEELDGSGFMAGEGDTRITTYSAGVTANWTHAPNAIWAAAVAAFQGIAPLTPPTAAKVQSSGKVVGNNITSFTITMPSPPTVGNSIVIGLFGYHETVDFIASITDNRGNTYVKAADGTTTSATWLEHASVWYCGSLTATGSPFVITVTCVGSASYVNADAIEYASGLVLDQAVAGDQSYNVAPSITTPAVSATAAVSMGVLSNFATQIAIGIPPGWVKEVEDLNAGVIAAGSIVTHGPTQGAAETAAWTVTTGSWTAVALAVFRAVAKTVVGTGILSTGTVPGTEVKLLGVNEGIDYSNYWNSYYGAGVYLSGQSISGHTGPLTAIAIQLLQVVSTPDSTPVNLYFTVNQGALDGPVLATSSPVLLSSISVSTPGFYRFNFPSPITLVAGTTYVLQLYRDTASNVTVRIYIASGSADTYTAGVFYDPNKAADSFGRDASFQLYALSACHTVAAAAASQAVTGVTIPSGSSVRAATVAMTVIGSGRASTAQLYAPTVVPDQAVLGATIGGAAGVYVPAVAVGGGQAVSGVTVPTGALLTSPTVTTGPVTVIGAGIATGAVLRVPSVTPGPVTILGATVATGAVVRVPSVMTVVTVVGAGVVGVASVFVAAVTPGPVVITGATVGSGGQRFAPTVTTGSVTIVGATRASTSLLLVPSVTTGPVTVLGVRITAAALLGPPDITSIAIGAIGTVFIDNATGIAAPTVVGGLTTILVSAISAGATSHPPSISVGPATILVPAISAGATSLPPSVSVGTITILAETCAPTGVVRAPSVATGPVTVQGATRGATSQVFVAAVSVGAVAVGAATILATLLSYAPSVSVPVVGSVTTATLVSASNASAPVVGIVGLWRVNGTGLVKASGPVSFIRLTLPQPAVGNAIVVLMAGQRDSAGMTFGTCTDNQSGHVYSQGFERRIPSNGEYAITVYYLPRIKVSTGPFTITVTGLGTDHCFEGCAIEVGGLTGGDLGLASYTTGIGNSATVNSGNTTALTGQHFVAAMCAHYGDSQSITVQAVTPSWLEEYEELSGVWLLAIAGEGDSRIATFSSAVASARWTLDAAASYVAGIAAFKVGVQGIGTATIPTTAATYASTVASVAIPVGAAQIQSGAVLWVPGVVPGPVTVQGATISSYPQTIVADGATHYWRLNESGGTGATDSVTQTVGVITGGVTLGASGVTGQPTAMLFDPTGKIAVGVITFGATAFTLEAWARIRTELAPEGRYLSAGQDAWPLHGMGVRNTIPAWPENILFAGQSDNIGYVRVVGTSALGRTWHHHVMAWGDRTIRLYVDGVLEYTSGVIDLMHADPYPYQIGDVQWDGWLENVAFYDRALTGAEVSTHAALGRVAGAYGAFAPTVLPGPVEVGGSTVTNTSSLAAPDVQAGASSVIAGTLARTALTYPPGILVPIQGATILKGSALVGPRVSLVDDRQLVGGAFIRNDAGTTRVMDVFDLLTIGPWLLASNIYAPAVTIPPNQTVVTDPITTLAVLYAPLQLVIVPIAATTLASTSRVFLPLVIPGSVEVGSPPFLPTAVVLLPPAVANPDRFGALTGVSVPSTLGALAVENLNPLTGVTTPTVARAGVAGVSGIATGVLASSAVATGTVTLTVPLPGALTTTAAGTVQRSTDAVVRGVIAGAVLKPMAVQIVVAAQGLNVLTALGVLSAPRVATVTGVTAQAQLALLGIGLVLPASPVLAAGDIGTLHAFSGVVAAATGVAATATSASLGSQRTIGIAALTAVPALGSVGLTLRVPVPAALTTGQIGTLGAQPGYVRAVTGVTASGTAGVVARAVTVPLTAGSLIATAGVVSSQQRFAVTGVATTAVLARILPEHLHLVTPTVGLGAVGAVGTLVEHVPVTVALVGVAATGDVGVLATTLTRALTTVLTGTGRGTLATATVTAVTGAASLSAVGLAKPGVLVVLPAVPEVGTVGTLGLTRVRAVTGVRALPTIGALAHQTDAVLTSVLVTTDVTTMAPAPGLSGVTATGAVGTLSSASVRSLPGISVHAAAGIVPVRTDGVLTTVSATGAVGDLAVLHRLAGVTATSATGALTVTVDRSLPSVLSTSALGTLRRSTVVGIAGVAAATAVGTVSAGADVTTALLNVRAWGNVGSVGHVLDLTIAPATGTGAVGVSVARPLPALTGVQTTSAVKTGTVAVAPRLAGAVGQGLVTTPGRTTTVGLTGVEASGEVGRLGVTRAWQTGLTGVGAAVAAGAAAVAVAPALTWVYVIGRTGHVGLTVDGVRTLTGVEADVSQGTTGIITRTLLTGSGATGRTGLLAGAGERTVTLTPAVAVGHVGVAHPLLQMPVVGLVTTTAAADTLGVAWATTLTGIRAIASPGVIGVTGADAPPEILDFTVVVKREEALVATVETVVDGWCVVSRQTETVVEVEPEPDYFSPVIIQRAPALHPLTVVAVKPEYLDVTVAVTQSVTVEALRSGVVDEVHLARRLDLDASLDADLDVSVRILIEQTYAVETER